MKHRKLRGVPKSRPIAETPVNPTVERDGLLGRIWDLEAVLVDLESFDF
jgi:hypothetical protein